MTKQHWLPTNLHGLEECSHFFVVFVLVALYLYSNPGGQRPEIGAFFASFGMGMYLLNLSSNSNVIMSSAPGYNPIKRTDKRC